MAAATIATKHTFVLLDGQHWQSIDDIISGEGCLQRKTQQVLKNTVEKGKGWWVVVVVMVMGGSGGGSDSSMVMGGSDSSDGDGGW